jgi:hypothetical protein
LSLAKKTWSSCNKADRMLAKCVARRRKSSLIDQFQKQLCVIAGFREKSKQQKLFQNAMRFWDFLSLTTFQPMQPTFLLGRTRRNQQPESYEMSAQVAVSTSGFATLGVDFPNPPSLSLDLQSIAHRFCEFNKYVSYIVKRNPLGPYFASRARLDVDR